MEKISVIIPTTPKEKEQLQRCVESVKASTYEDIEIIVVDEGFERSRQRNIGIRRTTGKYLLFLDSDQYIHPRLIKYCFGYLDGWDFDALYIPEIIVTKGWFGKLRNWERQFYTGTAIDVVRFVRANKCPRFDETMSGPEDSDFDRRIEGDKGISIYSVYHYDNVGIIKYLKKKAYYAKSMRRFKEKWPNDKVLNFKWRCWTVFTEGGKWKRLLCHPIMSLGLFALIAIRGIIYLCARKF